MTVNPENIALECALVGIGAWGPGFNNWNGLKDVLLGNTVDAASLVTDTPKPDIIPANERRRAPLAVKAAVDVSWQALQHSGLEPASVACVFGSGLGDTEITDYMCRVLTTPEKQLSPTKFHNSVHNAAAGYWTISTHCMKSANSIAGYQMTAGLSLMEGIIQCVLQNEPVLVTLFDIAPHDTYRQIFKGDHSFAAALLISPLQFAGQSPLATLSLTQTAAEQTRGVFTDDLLSKLWDDNPAAKILPLLQAIAQLESTSSTCKSVDLAIGPESNICINLEYCGA